jgi:hypothetical protein
VPVSQGSGDGMRSRGQARPGLTTRVRPQQAGPGSRAAGNNPPRRPEHAPHPGFRRDDVEATGFAFSLPVATVSGNAAGELLDILLEPTRDRVTGIPFYSRVADAQDSYLPPIAVQSGPAVIVIRIVGSKDRTARTALLLLLTLSRAPGYARIERTTRSGPPRCTMDRIARFQAAAAMSSDRPAWPVFAAAPPADAAMMQEPAHHEALRADVIGAPA